MSDLLRRSASLAPAPTTIDEGARTVELVWTTGAAVGRMDARGPFVEVLSLAPGAVNLSHLVGASVLDAHQDKQLRHVLGVVLSADVRDGRGNATVQFSARPDVEPFWQDVKAGILRHVSVGYTVQKWVESIDPHSGERIRTAIAWTPEELSFVPTPADPGATVRSKTMPEDGDSTTFKTCDKCQSPNGCRKLNACVQEAEASGAAEGGAAAESGGVTRGAHGIQARAALNVEIRSIARLAGLPGSFADSLIDRGATLEDARTAAFAELGRRGAPQVRSEAPRVQMGMSHEDPVHIRTAMAGALAARLCPALIKPEGRAKEFMGYRALDMAGELATARGDHVNRFDQDSLLRRALGGAHGASDFPLLLQDAGNKILLAQYQAADPTYRKWAARKSFNDFKPHKFLRVGDFPGYQRLADSGEVKYGTIGENREQVAADEYATGMIINRKALINDDLSALSDFSQMIAIRTAADENAMAYKVLASNPILSDGKALFHVDHGNLAGVGSAITVASVGAGRADMRKQTSLDGLKLNIEGTLLLVGPDKELEARQLVAAISPTKAGDANPWSGRLEVEVDANIAGNAWHLFGSPLMFPVVVYGYLSGAEGPQIKTETDFDTQAVKIRAGLDFGCGAIDFRGVYKNPGA